ALSESPHYVTALSEVLDLPQPTVSRHLSMLRQRSLVKCERNGTAMVYRIADERIMDVLETMRGLLRDIVDEAARSLET
ncbi:MAG: helix-turn-helix transcriptional regulator, partial [Anaerolineae bacterium]|nr:helix-turn-helix transcriptional regulator [Anaerolineae bacterium]